MNIHDFQGRRNAYYPGVLRPDPDHGFNRQPDGLFVGVHDDGNCTAIEISRRDDVGVSLGDVKFLVQLHRGDIRAADPARIAVRFWCQPEHGDLFHEGLHIPFNEAAIASGDVGVHAGTGNILADFLHHQHVDFVELQARHELLGFRQQYRLARKNLFGRNDLDYCSLVRGVLHHRDPEQHVLFGQDKFCRLRQQFAEHVHAICMQRGRADDLPHADGEHLDDSGLDRCPEVRMWFDARNDHHGVRFGCLLVHVDRHAIVELSEFHDFHARLDRTADVAFRNAVALQHFALSFGSRSAVAAHCRENKRLGAKRLEFGDDRFRAFGNVIDAARTAAHGDRHARPNFAAHFGTLELLNDGPGDAVKFLGWELLAYVNHAWQGDIESAGHVDFDAITD